MIVGSPHEACAGACGIALETAVDLLIIKLGDVRTVNKIVSGFHHTLIRAVGCGDSVFLRREKLLEFLVFDALHGDAGHISGSGVGLAAVAAVDVGEIRVGAAHLPDAGVHLFYKGFRVAGHPFRQNDAGVTGVGQHNAV